MFTSKITTLFSRRNKNEAISQSNALSPQIMTSQENSSSQDPPTVQRFEANDKIATRIDSLNEEMGKIGTLLTKELNSNVAQLKESMDALGQKLDEAVLSVKSTNSDNASPFNSMSIGVAAFPNQREVVALEPSGIGPDTRNSSSENILESVRTGTSPSEARLLVVACALLEIVGKNKRTIDSLYTVGLVSREQMRMISRVRDLLSKVSTPLRPRELAFVACHAQRNQTFDEETTRILDFLSTSERGGEICQAM